MNASVIDPAQPAAPQPAETVAHLAAHLPPAEAAALRQRMVKSQLQTVGLFNPLLIDAFERTAREAHVPASMAGLAYADAALEVAPGRFLLEPMALALLLEHSKLHADDNVLVVGAATGYSAAVIAACGARVTALENDPALLPLLQAAASSGGYSVAQGPLADGWAAAAPYSLILFEGAIEHIPAAIAGQLSAAKNGGAGRVAAVMRVAGVGHAKAGPLVAGHIAAPAFIEVAARPLPGFARPRAFAF